MQQHHRLQKAKRLVCVQNHLYRPLEVLTALKGVIDIKMIFQDFRLKVEQSSAYQAIRATQRVQGREMRGSNTLDLERESL